MAERASAAALALFLSLAFGVNNVASEKLMRFGGLSAEQRAKLQMGLKAADAARNAHASARELRYALDHISASLQDNGRMQASAPMAR